MLPLAGLPLTTTGTRLGVRSVLVTSADNPPLSLTVNLISAEGVLPKETVAVLPVAITVPPRLHVQLLMVPSGSAEAEPFNETRFPAPAILLYVKLAIGAL